jgi:predicted Fe-Mo cluster-binding NifX family protein
MKKIAIPVLNGLLSEHFGHAPFFYIYHTEGNMIVKEQLETPPPHEFGVIPNWLAEIEVTDLITGGIGPKAIDILNSRNINVYAGANPQSPKKTIEDFLSGNLKTTENLCNHSEHDDHNCNH